MADIFGWYDDLLANRYAPQSQPPDLLANQAFPQYQPAQSYQTAPDTIPFNTDMTPTPDTGRGTYWDNARQAAGDIYRAGAGVAERFNKGTMNMLGLRAPGAPMYQGEIPVQPGIERLGDVANFATGGLQSSLFPGPGMIRAGVQYAAPAAREAGRDVFPMLQNVLADEFGGGPAPRLGRARPPQSRPGIADEPYDYWTGRNPAAKFPQYAEQYPPTAPAAEILKEKQKVEGGTETYLSRVLTPEAEALMKERAAIQKDMDTHGFQPYYNPAERYYVDPSNYPPRNVTTSTLQPATFETIKKYMGALDAPETLANLRNAYDKGLTLGDPAHWYAMGQYEADFLKELGPEAGRAAFLDRFAVPMAATTSGNDPTANLLTGHFLEHLRQTGQPMPTHGSQFPAPMYGQRMTSNLEDYQRMRAGEATGNPSGYAALGADQPKMHNFARSFIGDLSQPVMDDQMAKGMLAHRPELANAARTTAFGLLQQPLTREAYNMGLLPGNLQDVAWAGFRGKPGARPMMGDINASIERQHRLVGTPREEIVRQAHIRKLFPMYGLLGAIGLGGLSGQADQY